MDMIKAIRMAVDTGNVVLGAKESLRHALKGQGKLFVVANNCPEEVKNDLVYYTKLSGIKLITFNGDSKELAEACGKPFNVSVLTVLDPGNSEILNL